MPAMSYLPSDGPTRPRNLFPFRQLLLARAGSLDRDAIFIHNRFTSETMRSVIHIPSSHGHEGLRRMCPASEANSHGYAPTSRPKQSDLEP
ncbi:hypothetical protein BJY00DRAFT_148333 [Aspergillus carlsbadensis]|nr:hypothetical protein BJY00DRAFT_148333 [Aspergillus carlsbadensis]